MDLELVTYPDPALRTVASPVGTFDRELTDLSDGMHRLMARHGGVGLAANQVGVLQRLFVYSYQEHAGTFVNPQVRDMSDRLVEGWESCLSLPGLSGKIRRADRLVLDIHTVDGDARQVVADGWTARIWFHELDHLNGMLFVDHFEDHVRERELRKVTGVR